MRRHLDRSTFLVAAATAFLAGCGGGGSDSAGGGDASARSKAAAQDTAAAMSVLAVAAKAGTDAIVADGTAGASGGAGTAASAAGSGFDFSESGSVIVDLDALGSDGKDTHPAASGRFRVDWSGAVTISQPTGSGGLADYTVTLTALDELRFVDARCGATGSTGAGSVVQYDLEIGWDRSTADTWHVDVDYRMSSSGYRGSSTRSGVTRTVDLSGQRQVVGRVGQQAGAWQLTWQDTARWTGTVGGPDGTRSVIWDRPAPDSIWITVDGRRYGPYSRAWLAEHWFIEVGAG